MPDIKHIALERATINAAIRSFFVDRGFVEVETPMVVASPGMEPNLRPFETKVIEPDGSQHAAGLITSPEYAMKKLLGQGMEKIFTITKVFRNEEAFGGQHNPEFSMLEWYQQGADYQACMDETEALVQVVARALGVDQPESVERLKLRDLFLEHAGVDLDQDLPPTHDPTDSQSDRFYRIFLEKIEPALQDRNVFLYDYPKYQAALSTLTPDELYGQRFELFMSGLELCNGFTELTDSAEQRRRFEQEAGERMDLGKTVFPIDEELLALLGSVQTPTYGNALGIDRLHMVLTGRSNIEDVLLFPANRLFKN